MLSEFFFFNQLIADYIKIIAPKLLALQPPFDMSRNINVSLQCRKDSRNFVKSLQSFELWALKSEQGCKYSQSEINNLKKNKNISSA